jgi:hypothetical protein
MQADGHSDADGGIRQVGRENCAHPVVAIGQGFRPIRQRFGATIGLRDVGLAAISRGVAR